MIALLKILPAERTTQWIASMAPELALWCFNGLSESRLQVAPSGHGESLPSDCRQVAPERGGVYQAEEPLLWGNA